MNLRSVLGFSFLTACSAVPPAPEPTQMDAGMRLDRLGSVDAAIDTTRLDVARDRFASDISDVRDVVVDVREIGVDVADESSEADTGADVLDATSDVVVTSRAALRLMALSCAPRDLISVRPSDENLLGLCSGRYFFEVINWRTIPIERRRSDLRDIPGEDLSLIVQTQGYRGVVLGALSVYQIEVDSSGSNVRSQFPAGHVLTAGGLYVTLGDSLRKLYAGTFFSDASYSGGEILVYDVAPSGALTARPQRLPDGGLSHAHVEVSGRPVGLLHDRRSIVSEFFVITREPPSIVRVTPMDDRNRGGRRLPAWIDPINQSEIQSSEDGRYIVFGNNDGRIVVIDQNRSPSTAEDGVNSYYLPDRQRITDVRVFGVRAYVSTQSGMVYVYSIPEGVLQETITTGSSPITAAEVVTGSSPQILFAGAGGLYAASL